ncbi:hypothetical protein IFM89_024033 [Coptis chinensis]|uniref:Uncharacterized protein n=1 Tax=Coptis chinensis TaxID=261450 RepID=A0A835LSM4_9MAGN|nr:hypothetical protein IFM89_024033 [Coptis chinensis]
MKKPQSDSNTKIHKEHRARLPFNSGQATRHLRLDLTSQCTHSLQWLQDLATTTESLDHLEGQVDTHRGGILVEGTTQIVEVKAEVTAAGHTHG